MIFLKPILIGIGIFAVLLAGVFGVTFLLESEPAPIQDDLNSLEEWNAAPQAPVKSFPAPAQENTVAPDSAIDLLPSVRYRNGAFSPVQITVKRIEDEGIECFLRVINESNAAISVRLGPYETGKEKGFQYTAISPGAAAVLDPRYTGIRDAVFYNMASPSEIFAVHIDGSCN